MEKSTFTNTENLPLSVREFLMRGQYESAIKELIEQHQVDEERAQSLIETYREELRERKIALDIQMMNQKNTYDASESTRMLILWGGRLFALALCLAMLYLLAYLVAK